MDMGPYYITALTYLMGRIESVVGMTAKTYPERLFTCKEHFGERGKVEVATHLTGSMRFESGAIGTIITSFDVKKSILTRIEIYGEKGTLIVPDPNTFGGPVKLYRPEDGQFRDMPLMFEHQSNSRGLGLLEMARAVRDGKKDFITSSKRTFHVLDVLTAFQRSEDSGSVVRMEK